MNKTHCPKCRESMQGDEIPPDVQYMYGNKTHFSRWIAMSDLYRDMVTAYRCPDCGHEEKRQWK